MSRPIRQEIMLSTRVLDSLRSPIPDPEALLIERESQADLEEELQVPAIPPKLQAILSEFLPVEEAMLLEAYFLQGQTQQRIATGLRRPKQSIQYRIQRAIRRAQWAFELETWNRTHDEMGKELGPIMTRDDVEFAVVLWENAWNQSHTAEWFGTRQSAVRVRVLWLHSHLVSRSEVASVAPYARDLTRVIEARAWCMGSGQVQGRRAITFPSMRRL